MKKKELAILLDKLGDFNKPKDYLEQWKTPGDIAADILLKIDFEDKVVADYACGIGTFGIGALLLNAKYVYFIDLDQDALSKLKENLNSLNLNNYEILNIDITLDVQLPQVDIVIMNPPFGTVKRKIDSIFIEKAIQNSKHVFALLSLKSKEFFEKKYNAELISTYKFPLKRVHWYHRKKYYYMDVGLFYFKGAVV